MRFVNSDRRRRPAARRGYHPHPGRRFESPWREHLNEVERAEHAGLLGRQQLLGRQVFSIGMIQRPAMHDSGRQLAIEQSVSQHPAEVLL